MNSSALTLKAQGLSKDFGGPALFEGLSFEASVGECVALTGPNGSGKSTLLQILWGYQRASKGLASLLVDGKALSADDRPFYTSFSAPYMGLPEAQSGRSLLAFHFSKRKSLASTDLILKEVGLSHVADHPTKSYSSGQRQRLRLAIALYTDAPALFLDEPCTNLDDEGIEVYKTLLAKRLPSSLVVIASNWEVEMEAAQRRIAIG